MSLSNAENAAVLVGFISYSVAPMLVGMVAALVSDGWHKYLRVSPISQKPLMPSLALPRELFFLMWILMVVVYGVAGWLLWYEEGGWTGAELSLIIWLVAPLLFPAWPICYLVLNSAIGAFFCYFLYIVWMVVFIAVSAVYSLNAMVVCIGVIFLFWSAYNALWTIVMFMNKSYRVGTRSDIREDYGYNLPPVGVGAGAGAGQCSGVTVARGLQDPGPQFY